MSTWNQIVPIQSHNQALRFSPFAWAKLLFLRDAGPTEVGAFGVSPRNDLLLVRDLHLIKQQTSPVSVAFDDAAVADYFDQQVDQGLALEQCARHWIHTHPGQSATPSSTDEATFAGCFGATDWSVMFILARGGQAYARLRFRAGPGGEMELPVTVDWRVEFSGSEMLLWQEEYERCVQRVDPFMNQEVFLPGVNVPGQPQVIQRPDPWDWRDWSPETWDALEYEHLYSGT